jgi:hypothetical protein
MSLLHGGRLHNPFTRDPISLSENYNPYISITGKYERPVVLVFERDKVDGLTKVDYSGANKDNGWSTEHDDRKSWIWEREWYTWDSPLKPALIGVILNKYVEKIPEEEVTEGKLHGEVRMSRPSVFIPISKLTAKDLKYSLDESRLESYDKGLKVY